MKNSTYLVFLNNFSVMMNLHDSKLHFQRIRDCKYSKYSINAGFIASLLTFILSLKNRKLFYILLN